MKIPLVGVLSLSAALLPALRAQAPAAAPTAPPLPTLYICGDSTAAPMGGLVLGWGQKLGEFIDPARLRIENRAVGGRSARTFIAEGRWEAVRSHLRPGDFIIVQFGHNDTKSPINATRYDLAGLGNENEEIANPRGGERITIRTFGFYMRKMIDEAKAAGATVVVLSPVPRCKWADGRIVLGEENHGPWAEALARAEGVAFLDANARIAAVYNPIGAARIKALYFPQDNTHTNPAGARVCAACIATGLADLPGAPFTPYLKDPAEAAAATAAVKDAAAAVKLALYLKDNFPAARAKDVPPDAPLRLGFVTAPTVGQAGKIRITDTATGTVVETIDLAPPAGTSPATAPVLAGTRRRQPPQPWTPTQAVGGIEGFHYHPVLVIGTDGVIFPRHGSLAYGRTYRVTIDDGVFLDGSTPYAGLGTTVWQFSTRAAPPAPGAGQLTVAADGTGDFCTVQGALDFIPEGNTAPVTILVRRGTYTEIIAFRHKDNITLRGEDRKETVLAYANNAGFSAYDGNPYSPAGKSPDDNGQPIYRRAVLLAQRDAGFTLENLTIRNTTPHGGSQSECIIFNGTDAARAIVKDVDLYSFQDTLQVNGQAYIEGCYIEGDVDFMWGTGPSFFENCTARSTSSRAYYTQIRNPGTKHGFVYYHCTFDGTPGVTGDYLARIEPDRFPHSEVVLIDCVLDSSVGAVAWELQFAKAPAGPVPVHFWEYRSHGPNGSPVAVGQRPAFSRQLLEPGDAALIRDYSDPAAILGQGWNPRATP
jgi:pectin methylesterase-like acyl-CoA thioesterase/lysophospholipase L1-like esterase